MKKILLLAALPITFLVASAFYTPTNPGDPKEEMLMQAIRTYLNRMHFSPVAIDDDLSQQVFDDYIERLDPTKRMFLTEDIEALTEFRNDIDDEIEASTFQFFDESVRRIDSADQRAHRIYLDLIDGPFELTKEEYVETDMDKTSHCDSEDDLRERWRKILKLNIIEEIRKAEQKQSKEDFKGEVKPFDSLAVDAQAKLQKRMDAWFNRRLKARRVDRLSAYLNSFMAIYDPHTNYFKPKDKEDFNLRMAGRLEGIGARLTQDGDYVKIVDVVPGGPAWKQGDLAVDDEIVKVAQEDGEAVDVVGWHIDDVIGLIRGKKGTNVRLYVRKVDGSEAEIPIKRDVIVFDEGYVRSYIIEHDDFGDRIGYIMLPSFYFDSGRLGGRSCAEDVKKELEKLKAENVVGVVLDLRNNGGGSLPDVVDMSGLFIESGPIVQVKARNASPLVLDDTDSKVVYEGPLIVMVNQGSASASEILAAAMQDYGRAVIIGNKTFGKGTVQRFYNIDRVIREHMDLKPFGEVKMTTQKFYRIDGGSTQLEGVTPDIIIPDPYQHFSRGERDYDHAMPWTKIDPATYEQSVYDLSNLDNLVKRSNARIKQNEVFNRVNDYADLLKKNKDRTIFPLAYNQFDEEESAIDLELDAYDKLYPEIEAFTIENLAVDLEEISSDTTKSARNERFLEGLKKDVELEETLAVMHDMIHWREEKNTVSQDKGGFRYKVEGLRDVKDE